MNSLKFIQFSFLQPSRLLLNSISAKNISKPSHFLKFNQIQFISSSKFHTSPTASNEQNNSSSKSTSSKESLVFSEVDASSIKNEKAENISRAMMYYLEKMAERDSIMKFKSEEFEIGKRHLAKMMGENPDTFTQNEIDKAIEYLLPSGLFMKKARPFLKHPTDYYPKSKIAAFSKDGRPLHSLFYTGNSEYYQVIYEMTEKLLNLNKFQDALNLVKIKLKLENRNIENKKEVSNNRLDLTGSVWITRNDLCKKLNAKIDEFNYQKFIILLQKLADHPYSKREEEYINNFKVPFVPPIKLSEIPALLVDEKGRSYHEVEARQRTAIVKVKLYEGTGNIKIKAPEGYFNIMFFESITQREQLLFPFKVVDRINKFDMDIEVNNGGMSCLAKAIRYATSKALCCFVSTDLIEKLRLAGLLTADYRLKERKKPGQEGARRKYTWRSR